MTATFRGDENVCVRAHALSWLLGRAARSKQQFGEESGELLRLLDAIAKVGVGFALFLGALGQVVTFVPGAEAKWFGVAAISASAGVLSKNRWVQVLAVLLALGLILFAAWGYVEGLRYQEHLRQRGGT